MQRTITIHVGLHKTGTTFLQRYFLDNRSWLLDQGVLFPQTGIRFPKWPTVPLATSGHGKLRRLLKGRQGADVEKLAVDLHREIEEAGADTVLLSSEMFAAPKHAQQMAAGLRSFFSSADRFRVVAYLRRQDGWLDSFYREVLGWSGRRETRDIARYYYEEAGGLLDYESRLQPWVDIAGEDNVIVRSYDDIRRTGDILDDFLGVLGIQSCPPRESAGGAPVNSSVPRALTEFLRSINAVDTLSDGDKAAVTRALTAIDSKFDNGDSLLTRELWCDIASKYGEMNSRIADRWLSGPSTLFEFPETCPKFAPVQQQPPPEAVRRAIQSILDGSAAAMPSEPGAETDMSQSK